ncbi:ABATE domain-containing protein [Allokutzneria sp. NRRL B-24872]|uniref:CGNR zinc finger domain-containing protein n=1 Tax=Allokutzneria sp. NRRL B-24872 TaxID=1137961 RepID=UPI000A3D429D|nr:CGNR zinc finger domain-containing protein [Allokutzneria sp. NRRL B-24872]
MTTGSTPHELRLRWPGDVEFGFDAGAVCLELLTTGGIGRYVEHDSLTSPAALTAWLARSRLDVTAKSTVDDLVVLSRLRTAIWDIAQAQLNDRALPRAAVSALNAVAASPSLVPTLSGGAREWSRPAAAQALSSIARDAVELFGSSARERLRECSADDCQLVFVDLSRPGQRRWCSMDRCGNRAKQRARRR